MRTLRSIMQDRLVACLVAGLLSYMLLLQGVTSAYALSSMAADNLGPNALICAPSGLDTPSHKLADLAHECCSSVCQIACAVGPANVPVSEFVALKRTALNLRQPQHSAPITAPSKLGLTSDARAPPMLS